LKFAIIAKIFAVLIWIILSICILLYSKPKPLRIAYWKIKSKMFPKEAESWIREMIKVMKAVCDFLQISEEELDAFVKILNKARYVTITFEKGRFKIQFKDKFFPRGIALVLSEETPTGKISKEYDLSLPIKKERV